MHRHFRRAALLLALTPCCIDAAFAHGIAGNRFFPATIQTDDPFVADEASLPTVTRAPTARDGTQEVDLDADLAKRLTPDIGFTIGDTWKYIQPKDAPATYGLDSLRTGLQYQLFTDAAHEAVGLIGLNVTWGHTGRVNAVGASDHTILQPTLSLGKGFGDLPQELSFLRPFAVTGNLGVEFPLKTESAGAPNSNVVNAGFAIEYSLEYLQHHVKDIGLAAPFDRLIPLVEFTSATGLNRGAGGVTTGVIAPGIIWAGQHYQIAAEAIIPYGTGQGDGVGGLVQIHFFLDDLFPDSLGKPIFGS